MGRITLCVMTEKGFTVCQHLLSVVPEAIEYVMIGRDKNIEDDFSAQIQQLCESHKVDWGLRGDKHTIDPTSYVFAISWRWMIKHPQDRLIVFHDSLLPKYRGFAPLVNMLINGETRIGVSALFGASEYDRGHLIAQQGSDVSYPITIADAIQLNNANFLALADKIARRIATGDPMNGQPQDESQATYSIWRDPRDYVIDWHESAERILRMIHAVGSPYAGARTQIQDGRTLIIDDAQRMEDVHCELRHCGKVIFVTDGCPVIICGTGLLKITAARVVDGETETPFLPLSGFRYRFGA